MKFSPRRPCLTPLRLIVVSLLPSLRLSVYDQSAWSHQPACWINKILSANVWQVNNLSLVMSCFSGTCYLVMKHAFHFNQHSLSLSSSAYFFVTCVICVHLYRLTPFDFSVHPLFSFVLYLPVLLACFYADASYISVHFDWHNTNSVFSDNLYLYYQLIRNGMICGMYTISMHSFRLVMLKASVLLSH